MSGPGFYRTAGDGLEAAFAPNSVDGPGVALRAALRATYTYPVDGWTWHADDTAASTALSLPSPQVRRIVRRLRTCFPNLPLPAAIAMANRLVQLLPSYEPPAE